MDADRTTRRWFDALRPRTLLDYWTAAAFLTAVVCLLLVSGLEARVLMLFLFPPGAALAWKVASDRASTRVFAAVFLTLIDVGIAIAPVRRVLPNLGDVHAGLSRQNNRILAWYVATYLLYVFCMLPPFLFIRGLLDRRRGREGGFSTFTCILGLVAWAIVGPGMLWVCGTRIGLWPIIGP